MMLLPLGAALLHSMSFVYMHQLKNKATNLLVLHYHYVSQIYYATLLSCLYPGSMAIHYESVTYVTYLSLMGLVVFAYLGQLLMTTALFMKEPSHIMPFGYINIIISLLIDVYVFGEQFDWLEILGMGLASSGLILKLFLK